ncbi:DedA family protein [Cellulomonas sp. P4]|uniref:DedA family protein n=1 Tax=Cellulomonas sp. P4 TaxID=3142533 RepID=UPI0031BA7706
MTDVAAAYGMAGRPLWFVFAALFVIVMARSHLFYWLGRGVYSGAAHLADQAVAGAPAADATAADTATASDTAAAAAAAGDDARRGAALRARAQRLVQTRAARRGLALVHRWGPLAVTFAYVTVGVQTAVFVGAGLLRMPYLRFVVASVPGSVAWSAIWGTVGLGVVWGAVGLAARSPWALAGVVAGVAVVVVVALRRHRAGRRHVADGPAATDAAADRTSPVV